MRSYYHLMICEHHTVSCEVVSTLRGWSLNFDSRHLSVQNTQVETFSSSDQPVHHTALRSGLRRNTLNQASVKAANDVKKPADAHQHTPTHTNHRDNSTELWVINPDRPDGSFHVILPRTRHLSVSLITKEEMQRAEDWLLEEVWFITWLLQTSRLSL